MIGFVLMSRFIKLSNCKRIQFKTKIVKRGWHFWYLTCTTCALRILLKCWPRQLTWKFNSYKEVIINEKKIISKEELKVTAIETTTNCKTVETLSPKLHFSLKNALHFFIFSSKSRHHPKTFCETNLRFSQTRMFYECFKSSKSYFFCGTPAPLLRRPTGSQ